MTPHTEIRMWGNFYCADLLKNVAYSIDTIQVFASEKVESDFCGRGNLARISP